MNNYQTTLLVIKPDCLQDRHVGEVLTRFEQKKFDIIEMKMITMSRREASLLYDPHKDKEFFNDLVEFMCSGSCIVVMLGAWEAVIKARSLIGADGQRPGTIRGDFATTVRANVVHTSDSEEAAQRELAIFFG